MTKVRFFAPGLAAGGEPARARFDGQRLVVEQGGARLAVEAARLSVRHGGYDGRQWLLEWPVAGGRAAILLPDGVAVERLLADAPAVLAGQIDHQGRRARARRRRFRLALVLGVVLALLPLILLGAFLANADRLVGWAVERIDLAQEERLGELAYAQLRSTLRPIGTGPAPAMVQAIGARLTQGAAYRYRWTVADDPAVNAFALPGGHVVVNTGLLRAAGSAEAVAGVLAHEVQHVELRHSLRNMIHGLGWRAVLAVALGDLKGSAWAGMAERLVGMAYGRDLERQADLAALVALRRAGIASHGMVDFFGRLAWQGGQPPAFLSSHPATAERLDNLRRAIAAQGDYPAEPLPYDIGAILPD